MIKVVVTINGGLVENILSTEPIEAAVVDYDIEGADEKDLTDIPALEPCGPEVEQAFASVRNTEVVPDRVEKVFAAIGFPVEAAPEKSAKHGKNAIQGIIVDALAKAYATTAAAVESDLAESGADEDLASICELLAGQGY